MARIKIQTNESVRCNGRDDHNRPEETRSTVYSETPLIWTQLGQHNPKTTN